MEWYTLRVISGKEKKVRDNLLFELDYQKLSNEVEDILVPSENIVEMRDGKKKVKNKVFFPGYLLINMSEYKEVYHLVENMTGVISFVGASGEPQPLRKNEITRILGEVEGVMGDEGKPMSNQAALDLGVEFKGLEGIKEYVKRIHELQKTFGGERNVENW